MDAAQWENISNNLGSVSNIKEEKKEEGQRVNFTWTYYNPSYYWERLQIQGLSGLQTEFKATLNKLMRPCLKIKS